ncbi:hypothetical protein, partial [Lacisediminimonas sp.]|uniref:hypothetical protein n=1 Tax=Lacisediminimonas sp. TaxID=3060582 RepID=UPI002723FD3A
GQMGFSAFFFGDFLFGAAKKKVTRLRGRTPRLTKLNSKHLKIIEADNQKHEKKPVTYSNNQHPHKPTLNTPQKIES